MLHIEDKYNTSNGGIKDSANLYVVGREHSLSKESSIFEMKTSKMYESDKPYYLKML